MFLKRVDWIPKDNVIDKFETSVKCISPRCEEHKESIACICEYEVAVICNRGNKEELSTRNSIYKDEAKEELRKIEKKYRNGEEPSEIDKRFLAAYQEAFPIDDLPRELKRLLNNFNFSKFIVCFSKEYLIRSSYEAFLSNLKDESTGSLKLIAPYDKNKILDDNRTGIDKYEIENGESFSYCGVGYKLVKDSDGFAFLNIPSIYVNDDNFNKNERQPRGMVCFIPKQEKNKLCYFIPAVVPVFPQIGRDYFEWFVHLSRILQDIKLRNISEEMEIIHLEKTIVALAEYIHISLSEKPDYEAIAEFKNNETIIMHYADKNGVQKLFDGIINSNSFQPREIKIKFPKIKNLKELKVQKINDRELLFLFPKNISSNRVTPDTLGLLPAKGKNKDCRDEWNYLIHIIDNEINRENVIYKTNYPIYKSKYHDKQLRYNLNKIFKDKLGLTRAITSKQVLFRVIPPEKPEISIDEFELKAANKRFDDSKKSINSCDMEIENLIDNPQEDLILSKIDLQRGKKNRQDFVK